MTYRTNYRRVLEVICGLLITISLSSCSGGKVVAFDVAKKGSVATVDVVVLLSANYTIYLRIPLPKGDSSEQRRLRHFAGSATVGDSWNSYSIPEDSPVHISILPMLSNHRNFIFDKTISKGTLMAVNGDEVDLVLAYVPLPFGKYIIRVEAQENIVALASVHTSLGVFVRTK